VIVSCLTIGRRVDDLSLLPTIDGLTLIGFVGKVYCSHCYAAVAGIKGYGHGALNESHVSGGAAGEAVGGEVLQGTTNRLRYFSIYSYNGEIL
jgi:hypothetical protein